MNLKNWLTQFKNRKRLIDRFYLKEVLRKGVWFYYDEWSILNVGKLMKSSPFEWRGFTGFEAMRHNKNNEIIIYRDDNLDKLLNVIGVKESLKQTKKT